MIYWFVLCFFSMIFSFILQVCLYLLHVFFLLLFFTVFLRCYFRRFFWFFDHVSPMHLDFWYSTWNAMVVLFCSVFFSCSLVLYNTICMLLILSHDTQENVAPLTLAPFHEFLTVFVLLRLTLTSDWQNLNGVYVGCAIFAFFLCFLARLFIDFFGFAFSWCLPTVTNIVARAPVNTFLSCPPILHWPTTPIPTIHGHLWNSGLVCVSVVSVQMRFLPCSHVGRSGAHVCLPAVLAHLPMC